MVQSLVHLAVAALLAVLTFVGVRVWIRDRRATTLIVVAVAAGLVFDNIVLGIGVELGHGALLAGLSWPRFVVHALLTPLLIVSGVHAAGALGLGWARRAAARRALAITAGALVMYGIVTDILRLQLTPQSDGGVVSYGNGAASAPVPAIVTILVLLALGIALWRASGWWLLAVGSAVMFVASGLGEISGLLTNVGELTLIFSLVRTEQAAGSRLQRPNDLHRPDVLRLDDPVAG